MKAHLLLTELQGMAEGEERTGKELNMGPTCYSPVITIATGLLERASSHTRHLLEASFHVTLPPTLSL